jgi:hypothetical protein
LHGTALAICQNASADACGLAQRPKWAHRMPRRESRSQKRINSIEPPMSSVRRRVASSLGFGLKRSEPPQRVCDGEPVHSFPHPLLHDQTTRTRRRGLDRRFSKEKRLISNGSSTGRFGGPPRPYLLRLVAADGAPAPACSRVYRRLVEIVSGLFLGSWWKLLIRSG